MIFAEFDMRSFAAPRAAPRFIGPIPKRIEAELVAAFAGLRSTFAYRNSLGAESKGQCKRIALLRSAGRG